MGRERGGKEAEGMGTEGKEAGRERERRETGGGRGGKEADRESGEKDEEGEYFMGVQDFKTHFLKTFEDQVLKQFWR